MTLLKAYLFAGFAALGLAIASFAWAGETPSLRSAITANGPMVTLGDLFENAGAAAAKPIAPAPGAGRTATFSARFVQTAARAAGLDWTAPSGLNAVSVAGPGASAPLVVGEAAIRRGEPVLLIYETASVRIATRMQALGDAELGGLVRLENPQTKRVVEAVATGAGSARALPLGK